MSIKIEKTAGGFKAEFEGVMYYSSTGTAWHTAYGVWIHDSSDEGLVAAFITQFIDPPKEQPAPKFKVGDRVVCVDAEDHSLILNQRYIIRNITCDHVYVEGKTGACFPHRFTLAPEPKVYSGDSSEWEPGVYRQVASNSPFIIFVDLDGDGSKWVMNKKGAVICTNTKAREGENYHRIASSITDIFVDGIMEMEAI